MIIDARLNFNGIELEPERKGSSFIFGNKADLDLRQEGTDVVASLRVHVKGGYRLSVCFKELGRYARAFIPSVWYRGNHEGEGLFPKEDKARFWSFMEHRMPLPGIIVYVHEEGSVLTSIEPAGNEDEFSSVAWSEDGIEYSIPGKETPFSYRGKTSLVDTAREDTKALNLDAGDVYERIFHVHEYADVDELSVYEKYLRRYADLNPVIPGIEWNRYEETKLARLLNLVCRDAVDNAYLKMGEDNGSEQDVYEFTSASFLVKSLEAASIFAYLDIEDITMTRELGKAIGRIHELFGDECDLKCLARKIGNHFLEAKNGNGIFRDCEDLRTGEKGGYLGIGEHPEFRYLVNARTNGEAMCGYVGLYEKLGDREYLDITLRVSSFYMDNQLPSGSFGRWWSEDGEPVSTSGTNGAYIGVFLIKLYPHLKGKDKDRCRKSILKAVEYYRDLALTGDFFGDTLDADSADKEAGISIMSLMLEALETFGLKPDLVEAARRCASFILSWVWHYDEFFSLDSPLGREGFRTKGMSAVSIAHHHLDFYGMLIARDFLRLHRLTGDEFYRKEAFCMADACRELIATQPGDLGRSIYGYQPEQVNHTSWDYFSRTERMNGTYDIDIAWNNVLGLSSYLYIEKEFPDFLQE